MAPVRWPPVTGPTSPPAALPTTGGSVSARGGLRPLRIAALVKQIPKFEDMRLGPDGRLVREGLALHMNDYCRRGVRAGCDLAEATGGTCTAITLGPDQADTVLREAILCGCADGLHVTGAEFAGSDTLATARALAAALEATGPWDLVMCGRNSVDADTGQVPAQVAEIMGLPLLTGVREVTLDGDAPNGRELSALLEHDDEWLRVETGLPAVVSCAERLCDPCKVKEPEAWATVDGDRIHRIGTDHLGDGPWGAAASPTSVGEVRVLEVERAAERLDGAGDRAVGRVLEVLATRGALSTAEAAARSARAFLHDAIGAAWTTAEAGDPLTTEHRRSLRLAACDGAQRCADALSALGREAGGAAVYLREPLQRKVRDGQVASTHAMVAPRIHELTGRLHLGLETDTTLL